MADMMSVNYDSLRALVGSLKGLPQVVGGWSDAQDDEVDRIIASGLRKFYWPRPAEGQPQHEWTFLRRTSYLALNAGEYEYGLPSDFIGMVGSPVVEDQQGGAIDRVSAEEFLAMRAKRDISAIPKCYAIFPVSTDPASGTRHMIQLYPTPDADVTLAYRYRFEPGGLSATKPYPYGGEVHGETIQAAVLSALENINGDYAGVHSQEFLRQLDASVQIDGGRIQ